MPLLAEAQKFSYTGTKRRNNVPTCTKAVSPIKTWCVFIGVKELECSAQSPDLNLRPIGCIPDFLTQHSSLNTLILMWLDEQIPRAT